MLPLLHRLFSRKTFVRLAFVAAALVTLLVAAISIENWRGERAWDAYRVAAEKRGERLQLADFVPPPIPDTENFAAVPVIHEVFSPTADDKARNPLNWPPEWKDPEPKLANCLTGERIDLVKWRDAFVAAHLLPQPSDNAAHDILAGLARYEPVLRQFHDAAQRPHSRFPVKWELNIAAQIPHLAVLRSAAKLDVLRMSAHLALGDSAAAFADWRDGLALYRALEHEPMILCGLVRVAVLQVLVEGGIWDGLVGRQWAEPELRAIGADLAGLNLLGDLQFAIASERSGMNTTIDWFRTIRAHERRTLLNSASGPESSNPIPFVGGWLYPSGWYRQSQVKMNELYDHRLTQIDVAHGRVTPDASADEELVGLKGAGLIARARYVLAALLMPALDTAEAKYAQTYSAMQEAHVACALELFRIAHGTFPEKLEELVPGFLEAIPRDVMDGAPLRYRRTADGSYALWSVGWNRLDDEGQTKTGKNPRDQPDWVWRS